MPRKQLIVLISMYVLADWTAPALGLESHRKSVLAPLPPPSYLTLLPVSKQLADPDLENQWWLEQLGLPYVWRYATGKGIAIAICDAGFRIDEPELRDNLRLWARRDFADIDSPRSVDDGPFVNHGTAVAALIAARRDGRGVNGIAFNAEVIPLQNFNYDQELDDIDKETATALCVRAALSNKDVDILIVQNQTRAGTTETDREVREAIRDAVDQGVVVILPAGNQGIELQSEERDDTGSIIVGAVRRNGQKSLFTNFGSRVDVAAYGEEIRTVVGPHGRLGVFGGTSAAAAQIGAAVALMLELNPDLTPSKIRDILSDTSLIIDSNVEVGGLLQLPQALLEASLH